MTKCITDRRCGPSTITSEKNSSFDQTETSFERRYPMTLELSIFNYVHFINRILIIFAEYSQ